MESQLSGAASDPTLAHGLDRMEKLCDLAHGLLVSSSAVMVDLNGPIPQNPAGVKDAPQPNHSSVHRLHALVSNLEHLIIEAQQNIYAAQRGLGIVPPPTNVPNLQRVR